MTSHIYNFGGALPPFLESWGGSSPSSPPLPPPLELLDLLLSMHAYTVLAPCTAQDTNRIKMIQRRAAQCVYHKYYHTVSVSSNDQHAQIT